ncbi:PTS sugar transporter subunit IIA [Falsibacillus albus]|uniref:PTS glucose transporter subunit IIA n=1 Tax=Falsibacillus albus TaxID=2478915 RepID=A0A3L7K283_9BACI|nr:PTS glucose transporter subunit IIA [Falsibacillus albus]RLQ96725.1 PTS glucose transporter subunit IIA [Falsibacillus albus]
MDQKKENSIKLLSPLSGEIVKLSEVNKTKFSSGMMGKGAAVKPVQGKAVAPCDGEVVQVFPTKHALTIHTENDIELMVQIGLDSEKLEGDGFEVHVEEKDKVKAGDPLITFDLDSFKKKNLSSTSPIVVVNANRIGNFAITNEAEATAGETILMELSVKEQDE